jgi:hypothetical protein
MVHPYCSSHSYCDQCDCQSDAETQDQSAEPHLVHLKAQHQYRDRRRALDQPSGEANMTLDDIRVGLVDAVLIHGANESSPAG